MAERWEHKVLIETCQKQDEEEYALSLVDPFVYRLYLANAMAERYTYMKDATAEFVIPLMQLPHGKLLSLRELLRTVTGWEKIKRSGIHVVPHGEARERCDRLLDRLAHRLLRGSAPLDRKLPLARTALPWPEDQVPAP